MSEIKRSADSVSEASELSANPERSAAACASRLLRPIKTKKMI
jgi:hypothetical protein